ncbi:MAG TPA: hypothetical protein VLI04_08015 [Nocardioidaceae bacterium]|nr:hypothetical protein [Nocardioidaceae bacterium]
MSGKHVSRVSAVRAGLRLAWVGTRELVVFAAVGVVAPVVLLVSLPSFFDQGRAMLDAPTCETGGRECLEPRTARLAESTGDTWTFRVAGGDKVAITLPRRDARPDVSGELHVLFWHGDPVALLQADGVVVESNSWGPLYGVSTGALLLWAPLWPLAVLALAAPLLWRRRAYLRALAYVAIGAAISGPAAYVGMWLTGYHGLVAGGLLPIAAALVIAGLSLLLAPGRRRNATPRRATYTPALSRMPEQRQDRVPADVW